MKIIRLVCSLWMVAMLALIMTHSVSLSAAVLNVSITFVLRQTFDLLCSNSEDYRDYGSSDSNAINVINMVSISVISSILSLVVVNYLGVPGIHLDNVWLIVTCTLIGSIESIIAVRNYSTVNIPNFFKNMIHIFFMKPGIYYGYTTVYDRTSGKKRELSKKKLPTALLAYIHARFAAQKADFETLAESRYVQISWGIKRV